MVDSEETQAVGPTLTAGIFRTYAFVIFLPARVLASVAAAGRLCVLPTPVTFCMAADLC